MAKKTPSPETAEKAPRLTSEMKSQIVDAFKASGKSAKQYAEENNIPYVNLLNWSRKLNKVEKVQAASVDQSDLEKENEKLKRKLIELILKYEPDTILKKIL